MYDFRIEGLDILKALLQERESFEDGWVGESMIGIVCHRRIKPREYKDLERKGAIESKPFKNFWRLTKHGEELAREKKTR